MMTISLEEQIACVERELAMRRKPPVIFSLPNGLQLIVEERDAWLFTCYRWYVRHHRNTFYLYRRDGRRGKDIHFHRELLVAPDGVEVDHANGNGLNNRRSNLRVATQQENNRNRAAYRDRKTGYVGVSLHRASGLYRARIKLSGAKEIATYHRTAEEAARGRDALAQKWHGEFACLNFPVEARPEAEILRMEAVLKTLKGVACKSTSE